MKMRLYSKLFGSIIGGVVGLGVSVGIVPETFSTPEIIGAITVLFAAVATWLAPANRA